MFSNLCSRSTSSLGANVGTPDESSAPVTAKRSRRPSNAGSLGTITPERSEGCSMKKRPTRSCSLPMPSG